MPALCLARRGCIHAPSKLTECTVWMYTLSYESSITLASGDVGLWVSNGPRGRKSETTRALASTPGR